jgi:hypothetical protein
MNLRAVIGMFALTWVLGWSWPANLGLAIRSASEVCQATHLTPALFVLPFWLAVWWILGLGATQAASPRHASKPRSGPSSPRSGKPSSSVPTSSSSPCRSAGCGRAAIGSLGRRPSAACATG